MDLVNILVNVVDVVIVLVGSLATVSLARDLQRSRQQRRVRDRAGSLA